MLGEGRRRPSAGAGDQQPPLEDPRPRRLVQAGVVAVDPAQVGRVGVAVVQVAGEDRDVRAGQRPLDLGIVAGPDDLGPAKVLAQPLDVLSPSGPSAAPP